MTKNNRAETLIALIITIIVLFLILTGVAISLVVGDRRIGEVVEAKVWTQEGDTITDGEGTTLQVGAYVNYDAITGASEPSYTSYSTSTGYYTDQVFDLSDYTYRWQVFGVEDEKLLLISENTIGTTAESENTNSNYYLKGRTGYKNALTELQNICNLYGQGEFADGVRSITVEDINKLTGYNPETANYGSGQLYEYGNTIDYFWQGTNYPYCSSTRLGNDIKRNLSTNHNDSSYGNSFWWFDTTLNDWQSSAYQSEASTPEEPITDASLVQDNYITTLESNYYYYTGSDYLADTSSTIYKMLFKDVQYKFEPSYYWLASRYVDAYAGNAYFGVRICLQRSCFWLRLGEFVWL